MKQAIIYGGAFNPPTNAHRMILEACIQKAGEMNAEVWIMPSGSRVDKVIATGGTDRLELIKALIESVSIGDITIRTELYEMLLKKPTETIETYKYLQSRYSHYKQTWVFGIDSIATMPTWNGGEELWQNLSMLVVPRNNQRLPKLPPYAHLLSLVTPNISSTMVRAKLKRGELVEGLVPKKVAALLKT